MSKRSQLRHVILTSHPSANSEAAQSVLWGEADPQIRGPVVASVTNMVHRNSIGTHSGGYSVYRALAKAAGHLDVDHRPDLDMTFPFEDLGPFGAWGDPKKIVSLDPWGARVAEVFKAHFDRKYDIRPTIAITKAQIQMPEIKLAMEEGRLKADGSVLKDTGDVVVTKAAVEPVWYLPGIAERFGISEPDLRSGLFKYTGGMYPELVTRSDLKVFLPPIGGTTVYMIGNVASISNISKKLTVRVHDECNGSDVFGSDICTCRPYLAHGIEEAVQTAQAGGAGVIVYFRKEGRALGEVTKFLVYNARKRQKGGDTADTYFARTECVAGVQDMRFQEIMPDVLHWLGIQQIDRFISMSDMKHDAIVASGIKVIERVPIPAHLIPLDAQVEMEAKKAAGYFSPEGGLEDSGLKAVKGRKFEK